MALILMYDQDKSVLVITGRDGRICQECKVASGPGVNPG